MDENNVLTVISSEVVSSDEVDEAEFETLESSHKGEWSDSGTKFMLERYELYVPQVGPSKKFKTKKRMWQEIATDLKNILNEHFTHVQVENRYKTVMKRKKAAVVNNNRTGASRVSVPYETEVNRIAALDDSIEPEVLRSANDITYLKSTESVEPPKKRLKKLKTIQETLVEIYTKKEENKERRHKEKMELLLKLINKENEKNNK